jgi:hypothetical protein
MILRCTYIGVDYKLSVNTIFPIPGSRKRPKRVGRIFRGAEVARIYVGSFHDEPLAREEHKTLFDKDRKVLMDQLEVLPKACSMRKVNEMVKRLRKAVVHVCIMGHLRSKMPMLWGKEKTQMRLIEQLDSVFAEVRRTYQLAEGDFPKIDEYRAALALSDMSTFPRIDRHVLNTLQDMLLKDVPKITALIAGVGSSASSGKFSRSGKNLDRDEGGEGDRLPQMFKFSEGSEGGDKRGQAALALVVAVAIALVAAFVASVMDDHRVLLFFSAELKRAIHDFQDKLTKH